MKVDWFLNCPAFLGFTIYSDIKVAPRNILTPTVPSEVPSDKNKKFTKNVKGLKAETFSIYVPDYSLHKPP